MSTDFCVCEGSNENCRYCYGTGRYSRPRAVAQKKEASDPRNRVYEEPSHYEGTTTYHGTAVIKFGIGRNHKSRPLIRCPHCAVYFRVGKLAKHISKAHPPVNDYASTKFTSESKSPNETLTQREPKQVTSSKLKKTLTKKSGSKEKVKVKHQSRILQLEEPRYESPEMIRKLDHTRLYSHSYRDNGSFGSHPSHDSFDDESKP